MRPYADPIVWRLEDDVECYEVQRSVRDRMEFLSRLFLAVDYCSSETVLGCQRGRFI